jgi:DeoR family transcriptional regulator, ulaG and ulaABCDEF operon transcriptional repressor
MRERQRVEILRNLLAAQGFLSTADLMAATGVSAASARRDAVRLAEAGYCERVYGGIQALGGAFSRRMVQESLGTQAFDVSRAINVEAKRAIAQRAVEMCVDGDANHQRRHDDFSDGRVFAPYSAQDPDQLLSAGRVSHS